MEKVKKEKADMIAQEALDAADDSDEDEEVIWFLILLFTVIIDFFDLFLYSFADLCVLLPILFYSILFYSIMLLYSIICTTNLIFIYHIFLHRLALFF